MEREAGEGRCDVSSIEQVMYLGQSLGRVGVDVRGLAGPVFSRSLCRMVGSQLSAADHRFVADMDKFSLESVKGVATVSPSFISHLTSTVQPTTTAEPQHHLKVNFLFLNLIIFRSLTLLIIHFFFSFFFFSVRCLTLSTIHWPDIQIVCCQF